MTLKQKINMACSFKGISQAELSRLLGVTPATLNGRIKVGKFTQEELEKIASVLGGTYFAGFAFPDGTKIM